MSMAHVSIVTEEYLGFPRWIWFSNCLQTSNSIYVKCCIKTCKYSILTIKENCQTDIWKETALIELCFFFVIWSRQIIPWGFVSFFRPGDRSFVLKSCPQGRDFDGKIMAQGSAQGGMVPGQIDTCISFPFLLNLPTYQSDCIFLCTVMALNYVNFKSTFQNFLEWILKLLPLLDLVSHFSYSDSVLKLWLSGS